MPCLATLGICHTMYAADAAYAVINTIKAIDCWSARNQARGAVAARSIQTTTVIGDFAASYASLWLDPVGVKDANTTLRGGITNLTAVPTQSGGTATSGALVSQMPSAPVSTGGVAITMSGGGMTTTMTTAAESPYETLPDAPDVSGAY